MITDIFNIDAIGLGKRSLDLSKVFLIADGAKIVPHQAVQEVTTSAELVELSREGEKAFLEEMYEYASSKLRMEVQYPGIKSKARIEEKAREEKNGLVELVNDPLRIAFIGNNVSKIRKAHETFSMRNNSRVIDLVNNFSHPDPENGMRRLRLTYALPVAGKTLNTEIQVWDKRMLSSFKKSHAPYERERQLKAALMTSASSLPHTCISRYNKEIAALHKQRIDIHNDAAQKAGLNKLVEQRTFGFVDSTPFVAIKYPEGEGHDMFILRPDAATGTYVRDDSLIPAFNSSTYIASTRDDFLKACYPIGLNFERNETQRKKHTAQVIPLPQRAVA